MAQFKIFQAQLKQNKTKQNQKQTNKPFCHITGVTSSHFQAHFVPQSQSMRQTPPVISVRDNSARFSFQTLPIDKNEGFTISASNTACVNKSASI